MLRRVLVVVGCILAGAVVPGTLQAEQAPSFSILQHGRAQTVQVVLDANWRWLHQPGGYANCFEKTWQCAPSCDTCELEGVGTTQYTSTYGVSSTPTGVQLQFVTGVNVGSRLYVTDTSGAYLQFNVLNTRFSFDLDVSQLPCGLNSAIYLVNMSSPLAQLGVGYGDAQCPTDIKYLSNGAANLAAAPRCGTELDLVEANSEAMAWTLHPCNSSACDHPGADMNAYRQGYQAFYGPGKQVDTKRPFTVVTEFTPSEIRRYYLQDGARHDHPSGALSDASASQWSATFQAENTFAAHGGLAAMYAQPLVLVLSIWDDPTTGMQWLDGTTGDGPGSVRGPCPATSDPRQTAPQARVAISNFVQEPLSTQ